MRPSLPHPTHPACKAYGTPGGKPICFYIQYNIYEDDRSLDRGALHVRMAIWNAFTPVQFIRYQRARISIRRLAVANQECGANGTTTRDYNSFGDTESV